MTPGNQRTNAVDTPMQRPLANNHGNHVNKREPFMSRADVLSEMAQRLGRLCLNRPVRVAIDGRTASGKTTLADELAALLVEQGRPVIRTSIDGFHRARVERYARGRHSAEGYYYDARDLAAVVALLLTPLGPHGDRQYRTASFDLDADQAIEQ